MKCYNKVIPLFDSGGGCNSQAPPPYIIIVEGGAVATVVVVVILWVFPFLLYFHPTFYNANKSIDISRYKWYYTYTQSACSVPALLTRGLKIE